MKDHFEGHSNRSQFKDEMQEMSGKLRRKIFKFNIFNYHLLKCKNKLLARTWANLKIRGDPNLFQKLA